MIHKHPSPWRDLQALSLSAVVVLAGCGKQEASAPTPQNAPPVTASAPAAPPAPPPPKGPVAGETFSDCADCPEMVVIPAGNFKMGGDKSFEDASDDEMPVHRVSIGQAFALGKHEVTQGEWVAVMGDNPSEFKGRSRPVELVSWNDAQEFIRRLNAKTGKQYRLPSEAEWEYAARAGSESTYSFGDDKGQLGGYAWYDGNSGSETHPVGQLKPNRFGLYDMHGNVWEWTQDCWNNRYHGAPTDGSAWSAGDCGRRVRRGGSWDYSPDYLRAANRSNYDAGNRNDNYYGFRVARTLP